MFPFFEIGSNPIMNKLVLSLLHNNLILILENSHSHFHNENCSKLLQKSVLFFTKSCKVVQ